MGKRASSVSGEKKETGCDLCGHAAHVPGECSDGEGTRSACVCGASAFATATATPAVADAMRKIMSPVTIDIGPVGPPVVGKAALDPNAPKPDDILERTSAASWAAGRGLRPVQSAGFLAHAKAAGGAELRASGEWAALYNTYLQRPVRR